MIEFLAWYLLLTALGIVTFPLAYSLFPGLAGRGYAFSRTLGLLLWGLAFWLLASLEVLKNDAGGMLFGLVLVLALSGYTARKIEKEALWSWWRRSKGMVLVVEVLFLLAFGGWALVRAMNPEITATEKPMELAFLNSILHSPQMPPDDPWLAGYAISYYYFGYVLIGLLAALTGTPAGIAFNLGVAAVFGLSAIGAYGVVFTLLRRGRKGEREAGGRILALFGPLFVLLVSNLEGFLDMLHARGLFWSENPDGTQVSAFWRWLDLKDLVQPPSQPFSLLPSRFLWWWRASRVVNDVSFTGAQQEVIDEFPFFSFLLSDLHPHVLAIPFVLLAVAVALNYFFRDEAGRLTIAGRSLPFSIIDFALASVVMGALAFLNTWDFPIYLALFSGAVLLREAAEKGWRLESWARAAGAGLAVGAAGVLIYLPFYIGFSSQAGGVLPNVINPTRGAQLWVMFGSLFVPLLLYLVYEARRRRPAWGRGLRLGFGVVFSLWILSLLSVFLVGLFPETAQGALSALGAPDAGSLVREALVRRFAGFGGWLTLAALLSATSALLLRSREATPVSFVAMMALTGLLLATGPEFFFLRDLFGTRMNTVFKFYYQAWILLSLSAGYGLAVVLRSWRGALGAGLAGLALLVVVMGLVYPVLSLYTKTSAFRPVGGLNLDGTLHGEYLNADDRAALDWLDGAPRGVLLEAVGGSYSSGGRIAVHSGFANVLGWVFHEGQWRGGYEEVGSRETDIARIYETASWEEARGLLETYQVSYVYVGALERTTYRVSEGKFRRSLPVLFEQGSVVIYGFTAVER